MELTSPANTRARLTAWLAAARAVLRLGRRQTRARRGSALLVVALLTAPVIAATASSAVLHSLNPTPAEQARMVFGDADLRMYGSLGNASLTGQGRGADALPAGSRVGELSRTSQIVSSRHRSASVPVAAVGGDRDLVRSRAHLTSGRWPAGPGETAVTEAAMRTLNTRPGRSLTVGDRTYEVVGVYRALRSRLAGEVQILRDGGSTPVSETLIDLPPGADADRVARAAGGAQGVLQTRAAATPDDDAVDTSTLTLWMVVLVEVALLVGAVFTVVREREARQARALVEIGASHRQIGAVALVRAVALAVIASVAGTLLGLLIATMARASLSRTATFAAPSVRFSMGEQLLLCGFMLVSTVAVALIALRPAAGPHTPVRAGARSTLIAAAATAAGLVGLLLASRADNGSARAVLLSLSGATTVAGVALLGTDALLALATKVRGGPPALRIGLRDMARHRRRTRGLMIAALAGLVGGTMAMVSLSSLAARDRAAYQPQLAVGQAILDGASQPQAQRLSALLGDAALAPVSAAQRQDSSEGADGRGPALVLVARPDGSQGTLAVADPAELAAFGIPPDAVRDGGVGQAFVLIDNAATGNAVRLVGGDWQTRLTAVRVGPALHADSQLPAAVITREAARQLGLTTPNTPTSWVLNTARPLTAADRSTIDTFRRGAVGTAVAVEKGWTDPDATFRRWLGTGVVAFGILSCLLVVVLAEAERARMYTVLHALGCSPWLRRRMAGLSAGLLSLWFVALATAVGVPLTAIALGPTELVADWQALALNGLLVVLITVAVSLRTPRHTPVTEGSI